MANAEPVVILRATDGKTLINSENYADFANKKMADFVPNNLKERNQLTTTKLRGIYAQIMNVYTAVSSPKDFDSHKSDIQYLKVKLAYEAGRESAVKAFMDKTFLMLALSYVKDYDTLVLYCRYAESLVAYFKFYGGKDK